MKTIFSRSIILLVFFPAVLFLGTLGCNTVPAKPATVYQCTLPETHDLALAVSMTQKDLVHDTCIYEFDNYYENLLSIASGNPKSTNKKVFSDFIVWCESEGILSTVQAKKYYNQYFNTVFAALPEGYNTCSYCKNLEKLIQEMKKELAMKETGLLKVCGNTAAYAAANEQFESMVFLLDSTCSACDSK